MTTTIRNTPSLKTDTLTITIIDPVAVTRTEPVTITMITSVPTSTTITLGDIVTVNNTVIMNATASVFPTQADECADEKPSAESAESAMMAVQRSCHGQNDDLKRVQARLTTCENTQQRLTDKWREANQDLELCRHDVWVHIHDGHAQSVFSPKLGIDEIWVRIRLVGVRRNIGKFR
jgi:hypothetical protein